VRNQLRKQKSSVDATYLGLIDTVLGKQYNPCGANFLKRTPETR